MQDSRYRRIVAEIGQRNDVRMWITSAHRSITEELFLLLEFTRITDTPLVLWNENTNLVSFSRTDNGLVICHG